MLSSSGQGQGLQSSSPPRVASPKYLLKSVIIVTLSLSVSKFQIPWIAQLAVLSASVVFAMPVVFSFVGDCEHFALVRVEVAIVLR